MITNQSPKIISDEKATFMRRFFAYAIDGIILGFIGSIIQVRSSFVSQIMYIAITAVYFVWPYSTNGQTLGKRALNIKVVSIDGSPLDWKKGVLRYIGYGLSSIPFLAGFLWALWDPEKQAFHDKIAGTCVVPALVTPEKILSPHLLEEVGRTQRRWLVRLAIIDMVILGGIFLISQKYIQRGVEEIGEMGAWPSVEYSPQEVAAVDLSDLGLQMGEILDPRDEETWSGGSYRDGVLITYTAGGTEIVVIWALRYADKQLAANDYTSWRAWVTESYCGAYKYANWGSSGVIHCQFSDAYNKLFWNDYWIIDIIAIEGTITPGVLVDLVRNAIAAHWSEIENP